MPPNPTASTPANPWVGRLHLAITTALFVAAVSIASLAVAGRVRFGETADSVASKGKKAKTNANAQDETKRAGGRYQIQKVEDVHEIIDRAGKSFLGTEMYDAWVFKYKGGLIETTLETELGGETVKVTTAPDDWKLVLPLRKPAEGEAEIPTDYTGYIIVSAVRHSVTVEEAIEPYHPHLGGILAFGSLGPLAILPPLFLEVRQLRPYRLFVSANPPPDVSGPAFNILDKHRLILVGTPLVIRNPAFEEAQFGGGNDLRPGVDELLLDRQRGSGRIRLKARFLTDGEAREVLPK